MNRSQEKNYGISLWASSAGAGGNSLKQFMGWLRTRGPRTRFSHADFETTLHRDLTLVENLLMAAQEVTLEAPYLELEAMLNSKLEAEGLRILASWFQNPRRKVSELTLQERFMAAVCYALLAPAEETLIDLSRVDLDPMCWGHLQKILLTHSKQRHITLRLRDKTQWTLIYDDEFQTSEFGLQRVAA